jgi:hypothetical protein
MKNDRSWNQRPPHYISEGKHIHFASTPKSANIRFIDSLKDHLRLPFKTTPGIILRKKRVNATLVMNYWPLIGKMTPMIYIIKLLTYICSLCS